MKNILSKLNKFINNIPAKTTTKYNTLVKRFLSDYPYGFPQHLGIIAEECLRTMPVYQQNRIINRKIKCIDGSTQEVDLLFLKNNTLYALEIKTNYQLDVGKCNNIKNRQNLLLSSLGIMYPNNKLKVEVICVNNYKNNVRNGVTFYGYNFLETLGFKNHKVFLNTIKSYCNYAKYRAPNLFK